jgi:hypothetical protein
MEIATLLANDGKCADAVPLFEKLSIDSSATFLKDESRTKMALCLEVTGNREKAATLLTQLSQEGKESASGKNAQKYLRLLTFKMNSEGKQTATTETETRSK